MVKAVDYNEPLKMILLQFVRSGREAGAVAQIWYDYGEERYKMESRVQ